MTRRWYHGLRRVMPEGVFLFGLCCCMAMGVGRVPLLAAGEMYIGPEQGSIGLSDGHSTDSVIRVGPPATSRSGSRIFMDRNPESGDRVIHVVPPPEEELESDVRIGPLLIIPEVRWPLSPALPGQRAPD